MCRRQIKINEKYRPRSFPLPSNAYKVSTYGRKARENAEAAKRGCIEKHLEQKLKGATHALGARENAPEVHPRGSAQASNA